MKVQHVNIIGHGTAGTDGIDSGIHLRWGFNDKLGFPDCFKLYRRQSDLKNRYEFHLNILESGRLNLPYVQRLQLSADFSFSLLASNGEADTIEVKKESVPGHTIQTLIKVKDELTIHFSEMVSRIELSFSIVNNSDFKIIAHTDNGDYYPYFIAGSLPGIQYLSFDAPGTTGLVLNGEGITIAGLAVWICSAGGGDWKRINDFCGCGLPVNQKGTPYTDDVYQLMGKDIATALCRLGFRKVEDSPITAAEFIELKAMLLTMVDEGSIVPVGWTLFPGDEEDTETELLFAKYDFLLAQSLQVFFAKVLGLYFIDTDVNLDTYYDYKITAEWPELNKRRLDHEIIFDNYTINQTFFPIWQADDQVVFVGTTKSQVVEEPYLDYRAGLGLNVIIQTLPLVISFLQPVTEVQLVLVNRNFNTNNTVIVEAYKNLYTAFIDREELLLERGMVRIRGEQIDIIKIYATDLVICRINYDTELYPEGLQNKIICGLKKQNHLPLSIPAGLKASFIPGGTITDQDGKVSEKPYLSGLRWELNEDPGIDLISVSPVMYHIERQSKNGNIGLLTENAPLFVSPSGIESNKSDIPLGWPKERQYYSESITRDAVNNYRVAAMDLFGRQSEFSAFVTYELVNPKPPHPEDVTAKFLDYNTYELSSDTFSDLTLNNTEKDWLRLHKKNAIAVYWRWPENLQLQAPDVEGFNVYFKQGWLNTYTGMVLSDPVETVLTKASLNLAQDELEKYAVLDEFSTNIPVYTFTITLDIYPVPPKPQLQMAEEREILPENAFKLCWLTQGNHTFLVLQNNGATHPSLWVLKLNDKPVKNKGFGLAVTSGKEYFINYKDPLNWTDTSVTHRELKDLTPKKNPATTTQPIYKEPYKVYIEDPRYPNPAIASTDRNKVRYAQIGVNAFVDSINGSVSPPATIMAVYRNVPAAPLAFAPLEGQEISSLKATAANVYGKSSFALRWNKSNTGITYQVYRALDETLFIVDNNVRKTRNNNVYTAFKTDHPEFNPADVDTVMQIPFESQPAHVASHYAALTPAQLQVLASLADNETAFTRINDSVVNENDITYEDRITEIPDPLNGAGYTPDPAHILLYVDKTLNGQSSNRYFYALRSADTNGLQSILSVATPPVEMPKTTPPPAPVITSVLGGENQVIIKWAKNPGITIAGYLLYRTQEITNAMDWRKMELIKASDGDLFTVAVNGSLPGKEFIFLDNNVVAKQAYYYGVVAIGLSDDGKWLKSILSSPGTGQAYDLVSPAPPVFISLERIQNSGHENILLKWYCVTPLSCLVKRRLAISSLYKMVSEWLPPGNYVESLNRWEYKFLDETDVLSNEEYVYQVFAKSIAENIVTSLESVKI